MGIQRWYWGQFVEVEHDENFVGVLELEVDLLGDQGLAHCNMHAIGGRGPRGVHSWPLQIRGSPQWDGKIIQEAFKSSPALRSSVIGFDDP